MTFRSESRGCRIVALFAALMLAGCGARSAGDSRAAAAPRAGLESFLHALAAGDVSTLCERLSATASAELARDFGGSSCAQTASAMVSWITRQRGERAAVGAVVILPTLDVPLSPAPYRAGEGTAALRVVIDDPVLGQLQALDVMLRRVDGRWIVDRGVNALFIRLARMRQPLARRASH